MIKTVTVRNMVRIEICYENTSSLSSENALVEDMLEELRDAGVVKKYINRGDFFIVIPEHGVSVVELEVDIRKLLGL